MWTISILWRQLSLQWVSKRKPRRRLLYKMWATWRGAELFGYFSWTLHKTGGCWLRSFISSQPLQAEAGHFLSLTYVLYKPRQCPTNAGFYSRKSLFITAELFACLLFLLRREWIVLGSPANADQHQGGDNSVEVKTEKGRNITLTRFIQWAVPAKQSAWSDKQLYHVLWDS